MKIRITSINPTQSFLQIATSFLLCLFFAGSLTAQGINDGVILQMGFSDNLVETAGNAAVTVAGNVSYGEDRTGASNCALALPGTADDYLKVASTTGNALVGNDHFSVSGWFKSLSESSPFQIMISKGPNTQSGFEVGLYDGNTPLVGDKSAGYGLWDNPWNSDPNLINNHDWHHVVFVRDGINNKLYLYRDGELRNSETYSDFNIGNDPLDYFIGKNFDGFIDDLRVYNRSLNSDEVLHLYQLAPDCLTTNSSACLDVQYDNSPISFGEPNHQPGNQIPESFVLSDGISLTLENWYDQNNNPGFGTLTLYGFPGTNNDLFVLQEIGMGIDFSQLPDPVNEVQFWLLPGCCGKALNISINDGPTYYYQFIDDVPNVLPNGTKVDMTIDSTFGLDWKYNLALSGITFENLVIGGDGISLNNFCFNSNPTATASACVEFETYPGGNGTYGPPDQNNGFVVPTTDASEAIVTLQEMTNIGQVELNGPNPAPFLAQADFKYDFSNVPGTVTQVSFTVSVGIDFHFAINGEAMTDLILLSEPVPTTIPGGGTVSSIYTPFSTNNPETLQLTIDATQITSLQFGGSEVQFDQVCYEYTPDNPTNTSCFTFTDFPVGGDIGPIHGQDPGFIMETSDDNIKVTLEEYFLSPTSGPSFELLERGSNHPQFTMISMSLKVDFANVAETVTSFSFTGYVGSPGNNFGANGEDISITFDQSAFPLTLAGGAVVSIEDIPGTNLSMVTISAPSLSSIIFGGTDMVFDDLCYTTEAQSACSIENLVVTHYCNDFYLEVDFDYSNPGNDLFELYLDGSLYGTYAFAGLPFGITLPNTNAFHTAKVCVNDNPNCCSEIVDIQQSDCDQFIGTPTVTQYCANQNMQIDFDYNNPGNDYFELYLDGTLYGTYLFSSLPLTIQLPLGTPGFQTAKVCINDSDPAICSQIVDVNQVDCNPCDIIDIAIEYEVMPCTPNLVFGVQIWVDVTNNSDSFVVVGNGQNYGTFSYTNNSPFINPFVGDGTTVYELGVYDQNHPNCIEYIEFGPVDCQVNDCEISDLFVEVWDCDANGDFLIDINFNYTGVSDSFILAGNGNTYGTFAYSDLWLTTGPFPGDGTTNYEFVVYDSEDPSCSASIDLGTVSCAMDCNIFNLVGEASDCNADGWFTVDIDFDIQNPGGSGFMVVGNGTFFGIFDYANLPITLGPFLGNGINDLQFNVFDVEDPFCIGVVNIEAVNCNQDCELSNLVIEEFGCQNGVNKYLIDLDYVNPGSDGFKVNILGNTFGPFAYADLPLFIEYPSISPATAADVQICDFNNPNCCVFGSIEIRDCDPDCPITSAEAIAVECFNGEFYVLVEVESIPTTNSTEYKVSIDGVHYGPFLYTESTQILGPFTTNQPGPLQVEVYDPVYDCSKYLEVHIPQCPDICEIWDLEVIALECTDIGKIAIKVDFNYSNPGNDLFDLTTSGGVLFGTYSLVDLPIIITGYPDSDNTFDYLQVCINDNPNCCKVADFESLDCGQNQCGINDLFVYDVECNGDSLLILSIDFEVDNPSSDSFTISNNGNADPYPHFAIADLPIRFDQYHVTGEPFQVMQICLLDDPNCCISADFDIPNCNCLINDITATPTDCNADDQFYVNITFGYQNPFSDQFTVHGNGTDYGSFNYADLPIQLGPFDGDGNTVLEFVIADFIDPNCAGETILDSPFCDQDCVINDVIVTPTDCNDDGQFYVDLTFFFQSSTSDQFTVNGNGTNYGDFNYADLPIQLGPFDGDGNTVLEFIVTDTSDPNCQAEAILDSPFCDQDCNITDLYANWEGCNADGTGNVYVNFNYQNPGNDYFDVYFQGSIVGTYKLINLPITIHNFPNVGHNQGFDEIKVCINDHPDCCETIEFDVQNCDSDYTCIDFEELSLNQVYTGDQIVPGEFIFESNGVDVSFGDCYEVYDGSIFQIRTESNTGTNCGGVSNSGQTLFLQSAGIKLDFTGFNPIPSSLSFDFCNEGYLSINGIADSIFFDSTPNTITLSSGHEIVIEPYAPNSIAGSVTITGELEFLTICGGESTFDNICFNSTPPTPNNDCVAFEELEDGFSYNLNNHDALLLESNGVEVTMLAGLSYVQATSTPQWTMFNAASGLHLFLGGELEFDFTGLGDPTEFVSFDFSGGVENSLIVNGGNEFNFNFNTPDTVLFIAPGVTMFFNRDATNTSEGNISLFGEVEHLYIGGIELAIDNVCYYTTIQDAQVWPGDANSDNISNHCDLLNIGVAFGQQGTPRPNQSTNWDGLDADDWNNFFADGITNFKHSDCNGDGIINGNDLEAIELNYGLEHGPVEPIVTIPGTDDDPPFYVDLETQGVLTPGQFLEAPVVLGSFDTPVEGIYGIAFTIEYDPEMLKPGTVDLEVKDSWFGTPGADLMSIDRSNETDGRIEVAITRIDKVNVGGFGDVANFIGVIDDIVGKQAPAAIKITNIKAINAQEEDVVLFTPDSPGVISTEIEDNKGVDGLVVFPIPTTDVLNIHNYNPVDMRLVTVYNALGQKLHEERYPKQKTTVDVSDWPSGIYFIDIKLPDVVITKRFKVTRL